MHGRSRKKMPGTEKVLVGTRLLHHWRTKICRFASKKCRAFPSQGKMREGRTIIQKYYRLSIYTKLNADRGSTSKLVNDILVYKHVSILRMDKMNE